MNLPLSFSPEVSAALQSGTPIVALESTIITHGMPYPQNLEMAREVETIVRAAGAVPATIAIMNGKIQIGLTDERLVSLSLCNDAHKISRADLAVCLSEGWTGATTVAATMICAKLAGIEVFATGGIGGVHRGAEDTFDISADLLELAQTSVTVVAAGAKAILDLPKTLEVLETNGVPVIAYQNDAFPAFWSRSSGLDAPLRMDSPAQIAKAVNARNSIGLTGGHLIANPIPQEVEIPREVIEPIIAQALKDAHEQNVRGKEVTPFLLQRIFDLTEGRSLRANIGLVKNNARLAAEIAAKLGEFS